MVKREEVFILSLMIIVMSINLVSAEVWFVNQPSQLYSLGDVMNIDVAVSSSGYQLEAQLNCQNQSRIIFLQYLVNGTKANIVQPLNRDSLGDMIGRCKIILKYGDDEEIGPDFSISENIFINAETKDKYFEPGKDIVIKGRAEKANGKLLEGFYEITFGDINFSKKGDVQKGEFELNMTLPETIKAGSYLINISVYDKIEEKISNKGAFIFTIGVKQVAKEIDIALGDQNVNPGGNLSFKIMLYDQSGEKIEGEASYLIETLEVDTISKSLTEIDKEENFFPETNLSPGYYKIKAYSAGLFGERQFYVEENEQAEFKIINGTLVVKNIGNVNYQKSVQVKIGDIVELINDEIGLGEEKKYEIVAPDGDYNVIVTDGTDSFTSEGVGLTGRAIAIREVERGFFERSKFLAWAFLLLVLGMFIFVSSRKTLKGKFVLTDKLFGKRSEGREKAKVEEKGGVVKVAAHPAIKKDTKIAEHSLVLSGKKYDTSLICIKIKNNLEGMAKLNLDNILKAVHENKGTIYRAGDYIIPIFSPLTTKTFKTHVPAVKTALEITKKIQESNKKYKDKIEFGISVHSGDLVGQVHDNKLKFTSVANTVAVAKKIADLSDKEVLLSKTIHEKTIAEIKTNKTEKQGMEVFTVKDVINRDENKVYINEFLKRMESEKK